VHHISKEINTMSFFEQLALIRFTKENRCERRHTELRQRWRQCRRPEPRRRGDVGDTSSTRRPVTAPTRTSNLTATTSITRQGWPPWLASSRTRRRPPSNIQSPAHERLYNFMKQQLCLSNSRRHAASVYTSPFSSYHHDSRSSIPTSVSQMVRV